MKRITTAHKLLTGAFALACSLALAGADLGVSAQNSNGGTGGDASAQNSNAGGTDARALEGTQENLSGVYTGTVRTSGGHEMSTPATLTIADNTFTLTSSDGVMTHTGSIVAVNSRGYIGAALRFADMTDAVSNTPLTYSVRARRSGDRLTLSPAPGARNQMWFTPAGGGGGRRGRRGRRPADDTVPVVVPTPPPPAVN